MGGIFQLQGDEALILTQVAEKAEEIDVERALEAKNVLRKDWKTKKIIWTFSVQK